jgi:ribosome-associated protein
MNSKELAKIAYNALDDKKGINISIIDISHISIIADYFIISGGLNENQVKALADNVEEMMYTKGNVCPKNIEGYDNAGWILMDFNDVIVHIFNEEDRLFYDLERIWRDGKYVNIEDL